ncbi:hypothetical protein C8J56DRAFT_1095950 [Mycena floridula]|nr:hypothetical protein C8J56DRAFT_1095950 [Mycena floridula]
MKITSNAALKAPSNLAELNPPWMLAEHHGAEVLQRLAKIDLDIWESCQKEISECCEIHKAETRERNAAKKEKEKKEKEQKAAAEAEHREQAKMSWVEALALTPLFCTPSTLGPSSQYNSASQSRSRQRAVDSSPSLRADLQNHVPPDTPTPQGASQSFVWMEIKVENPAMLVIFLSDGECGVTDFTVRDLCRASIALGKPLSFHAVAFGPSNDVLQRMVEVALDVQNSAPVEKNAPAGVLSSYSEALDSVRLTETFLGIAESLKKPRGSLARLL